MIRRLSERYGPALAAAVLAMSFVLFALAGIYTVRQQHQVDSRLCAQAVDAREGLRRTWIAAETLILAQTTDEEAKARTQAFFQGILDTIPELECVDRKPVEVE